MTGPLQETGVEVGTPRAAPIVSYSCEETIQLYLRHCGLRNDRTLETKERYAKHEGQHRSMITSVGHEQDGQRGGERGGHRAAATRPLDTRAVCLENN